ncbi:MAG: FAD-dependent oxidoreductase [Oceanicaulis sp.]|nr:FAD-dependent oxidoreductase [Oceanicaulis sp.]
MTAPLPRSPVVRDLVLAGGGHAHALMLARWRLRPGVRVTLIHPGAHAPYTGMLPGHVAGHYPLPALKIDLARLCAHAGARHIDAMAGGLDLQARTLQAGGRQVRFDVLSLDIGAAGAIPALEGAERIVPARPLDAFAARWARFVDDVSAGKARPEVCIIGAGAAGVELALAAAHRLNALAPDAAVNLAEAGGAITPDLPARARRTLVKALDRSGVQLVTGAQITRIDAGGAVLADGARLPGALVISAAGVRAHAWLAQTGLALHDGYVAVDAHLQSLSHPGVFACGDCAHLAHAPRPKAGVYAVRAAPVLARNLAAAAVAGGRMRRFKPQRGYLRLIALGGRKALAARNGLSISGGWVWRWKDAIDRAFMKQVSPLAPPRSDRPGARGPGE